MAVLTCGCQDHGLAAARRELGRRVAGLPVPPQEAHSEAVALRVVGDLLPGDVPVGRGDGNLGRAKERPRAGRGHRSVAVRLG
jgi:hypothetical protein